MIFLFGIGQKTHSDHGPLNEQHCPYCHQKHFRILLKVREWFSVFFIPIIPVKSYWVSRCTYCSGEVTIRESDVPHFQNEAEINQKAIAEDWDDETYQRETHKTHL
ncbi:zinc ribbon domain-containing protein [Phaeocystidibacter luteus]|uniref:Zinc-ribbon domain-containing protein n=1 Tax=Phaeocystidibacter luteus TaxID=911197 RepID=A0A6N6RJH2_9FLAO|nr:zinc-ribbon domain-containing protein [Phaeocystidibacter luteus]KAB2814214.1 zinc-ribbon domain-containing protein [Phaeocystidibacter luteus]